MKKLFTLIVLAISGLLILPVNGQNLLAGWEGNGVTGDLSKPNDVGWLNTTTSIPWSVANGAGGCRFRDLGVTYTETQYAMEAGGYLSTRFLMLRFDNSAYSSSMFSYPVTLQANTTYDFTLDYVCGGSGTPPKNLTVGISTTTLATGRLTTKVLTTTNSTTIFRAGKYTFTSGTTTGLYYITFTGEAVWFGIANLNISKSEDDLTELTAQTTNLSIGDVSAVTANISLPTTLGTKGVTVRWASSKPSIIDTLGTVVRPQKYDANVTLTATLYQTINSKVYSTTKPFKVKVLGLTGTPEQLAEWDFTTENITYENDTLRVTDIHSKFKGKLINEARIRTIGNTEKINVLDLGIGKGYFDMGKDIGEAIYSLSDFTMMGYFRIDETYTNLTAAGNYYWNFSNSANIGSIANGFMYGRLNSQAAGISAAAAPSIAANAGVAAGLGTWHHFAFTQTGSTGTVFVDGVQMGQNISMPTPSTALAKDSMTGTICNWLGRSGWTTDAYLQKTLLYGFQVLSIPISSEDLILLFGVPGVIEKLNNAYTENPEYIANELQSEVNNLTLGNISGLTSNIVLPNKGTLDPTITITWKSSNTALISNSGVVTRPDYFPYKVTLTATLLKNGQSTTKTFEATVLPNEGTQFNNDLLVRYDFSQVNDSTVTDVAEKGFKGVLKNGAKVHTIGTTKKFNVLELGDSIGYFDMGLEIGKLAYNLNDYSIGAYYRVDTAYHQLASNGNFLFTLSNTNNAMTDQTGYIIGSLKDQSLSISPQYYTAASGNQAVSFATPALQGNWHHLMYTQSGTVGTLYVDGTAVQVSDITNLPSTTLPKSGRLGTIYNWIGRSNYASDVYLRKTKVYDFRLYRRALTDLEIMVDVLNIGNTIGALEQAYNEDPTAVEKTVQSDYKVISKSGEINILGLDNAEKVVIFDIAGRQLTSKNNSVYKVNAGVYVVKINDYVTKVIVR